MEKDKENLAVNFAESSRRWPAIMVDIETLATSSDATVLEIGAVCFDLEKREQGPHFHRKITLSSNAANGRKIDADTLHWWMDRFRERGECDDWERDRDGLTDVLCQFWAFWEREAEPSCEFWCRGSLDAHVLEDALLSCMIEKKGLWHFASVRDHRSILAWEGVKNPRASHGALADAMAQVGSLAAAADKRDGRWKMPDPDLAAGWAEYRESLATTQAALIPVWEQLPSEVREAFAAGVRAAVKGGGR